MKKYFLILFLFVCTAAFSQTSAPSKYNINASGFVENKGQLVDPAYKPVPSVKYLLCQPGFNVQLRQSGFSYDTYVDTQNKTTGDKGNRNPIKDFTRNYHRVDIDLVGCNQNAEIIAEQMSSASFNYFTPGMPQGGVSDVHYYQKITYKNIYPNIDLQFLAPQPGSSRSIPVEYQFIVHKGGNPADIKLSYTGENKISLDNNKLVVSVARGDFAESIPKSYLKASGKAVNVTYTALGNDVFTFTLPKNLLLTSDLIIDPIPNLLWGTYYGGPVYTYPYGIALDANGNVYITGITGSVNNIVTLGAFLTVYQGFEDVFIAKFNSTGTSLVWGTYYGGTGEDIGQGIALDASKNVYITGYTESATGIATLGAYKKVYAGRGDAFVAKFNSSGSSLLWGTYYGGIEEDTAQSIALDASDNVYITGSTSSPSGIATGGAYQTSYISGTDNVAFVAKFNSAGSSLLWGTYYGGANNTSTGGRGIVIDATTDSYITGYTNSAGSIATAGAYQTNYGGHGDAFVAEFNPSGSSLLWGTYYGGDSADVALGIAIDASDNTYITGYTTSDTNIATPAAFQTTIGGNTDAFVAKFNATGSTLVWGSYYGGLNEDIGQAIVVDPTGSVYITGVTTSFNGIATAGSYQPAYGGNYDAFIAKFNPFATCLLWGTYYGGPSEDLGNGIVLDANNDVYITGYTGSSSGIATKGAYQTVFNNGDDAFVAEFNSTNNAAPTTITLTPADTTICAGKSAKLNASGSVNYSWSPTTGLSCYTCPNPLATPTTTTIYRVSNNASGCLYYASDTVRVRPAPKPIITGKNAFCLGSGSIDTLTVTGGNTYKWSPGGITGSTYYITANNPDTLVTLIAYDSACSDTTHFRVSIVNAPQVSIIPPAPSCTGTKVTISTSIKGGGSYTYKWSPGGATTSNITVDDSAVTYNVIVSSGGCKDSASTTLVTNNPTMTSCCDKIITIGDDTILTAHGSGLKGYKWSPPVICLNALCDSVKVSPTVTTTYTVTGTKASDTLCKVENLVIIVVETPCFNFTVPNVFTPTYAGPNGTNNVFYIKTEYLTSWSLDVFDRWGKEVYTSTNQYQYWNGETKGGDKAPEGVYYYVITADCHGTGYKKDGYVQLIR